MKLIFRMMIVSMGAGILLTQGMLLVGRAAGITEVQSFPVPEITYLVTVMLCLIVQTIISRPPKFPSVHTSRLLETEGYSAGLYAAVFDWQRRCEKYGEPCKTQAELACAELLIDGGHFSEGFKRLESIEPGQLTLRQKQVYFNTLLYGKVISGERKAAEQIYDSCKSILLAVSDRSLSASVKHTLGCYKYSLGAPEAAEKLFMQALDSAVSDDVLCEIWLSLTACYIDTERLVNAKSALYSAAEHAYTMPLKQKVKRAKELLTSAEE